MSNETSWENLDIDAVNAAQAKVKPPKWVEDTDLPPGLRSMFQPQLDEQRSRELDAYYSKETLRAVQALHPQDPGELSKNVMSAFQREMQDANRVADPEYDLMQRGGADLKSDDYVSRLALQRARDRANDEAARYIEQGKEMNAAERKRFEEDQAAAEEARIKKLRDMDPAEIEKGRAGRLDRLMKGGYKLKEGRSLLSLEEFNMQGTTLLTK